MMDDKRIRAVLQDALEEEIPSSQVDLWPAVKASLVAGKTLQQGEKMDTTISYRRPRLALAIVTALAVLVVVAVTPQGRALAQNVLEFFKRTESTTFPVDPSLIVTDELDAPAPTAVPPAPLISVAEAEARVGFDIAELPYVPDGFNYLGARQYGQAVNIEYETPDHAGHLSIMQSPKGFLQSDWDRVPAEASVPVKIGELDGEFIKGRFVVYSGETVATWNPDAPIMRLRWLKDGVWFEMNKHGYAEAIAYLDQAGMIELAESLAVRR